MLSVVAPIKSSNKSKMVLKHDRSYIKIVTKIKIRIFFTKSFKKTMKTLDFIFVVALISHANTLKIGWVSNRKVIKSKFNDPTMIRPSPREAKSHVIAFWPIVEFSSLSLSPLRQGASTIVEIMIGIIRMKFCLRHLGPTLQKITPVIYKCSS